MAATKKKGVVRAGRTVHLGEKKGDRVVKEQHGPGSIISVDADEYDRLTELGALAKPGSPEAQVAMAAADQLPKDFPGYEDLVEQGITTYSDAEEVKDWVALDGIGDVTAEKIKKALAARAKG